MKLSKTLKLGACAAGAFIFGLLFGWVLFPVVLKSQLKKEKALSKKTDLRAMWTKVPFALDFKVYLFNYTNPEDIQKGARPIVKEIGPYYFEEWKEKVDLKDYEENDTISYKRMDTFYFKKELSGPGLTGEEIITTPHSLILGIGKGMVLQPDLVDALKQSLDILFDNPSDIFLRTKVMDFLFRGIIVNCSSTAYGAKLLCNYFRSKELERYFTALPNNIFKISLFGSRNGTVDKKVLTVLRGIKNVKDVGRMVAVDGKPRQEIWRDACNEFVGTDGTVFPPFVAPDDGLYSFAPDFCRDFHCWYESKTVHLGVKTDRYVTNIGDFANDPKLQCFCETPETCPKKGLMDLSKCIGFPVYVSLPHYLDSDQSLLEDVKGLKPDRNLHGIEIDFEPFTGTPLTARQRVQANIALEGNTHMELFAHIPNITVPILWIDEGFSLNKTYVNILKYNLFLPKRIVRVFCWLLVLGGAFGMIATLLYHFKDDIMNYIRPRSTQTNRIEPQQQTVKNVRAVHVARPTNVTN